MQHPLPSPKRCYNLGKALGKAIESYPEDKKVVVIGTGGLSHQLDGERAGFINKDFDKLCMEKIVDDPEYFLDMSIPDLVREAGAQGAEFILWLTMRAALGEKVTKVHEKLPHSDLEHRRRSAGARQRGVRRLPSGPGRPVRTDFRENPRRGPVPTGSSSASHRPCIGDADRPPGSSVPRRPFFLTEDQRCSTPIPPPA